MKTFYCRLVLEDDAPSEGEAQKRFGRVKKFLKSEGFHIRDIRIDTNLVAVEASADGIASQENKMTDERRAELGLESA